MGFMTLPRTVGRQPMCRFRPALPMLTFSWSMFPTWPTVAMQSTFTSRTSPEGRRIWASRPSLAMSWAEVPAERTSCAPLPGCISTLWITVPTGMLAIGRALPGLMSAAGPDSTLSPAPRPTGARM